MSESQQPQNQGEIITKKETNARDSEDILTTLEQRAQFPNPPLDSQYNNTLLDNNKLLNSSKKRTHRGRRTRTS